MLPRNHINPLSFTIKLPYHALLTRIFELTSPYTSSNIKTPAPRPKSNITHLLISSSCPPYTPPSSLLTYGTLLSFLLPFDFSRRDHHNRPRTHTVCSSHYSYNSRVGSTDGTKEAWKQGRVHGMHGCATSVMALYRLSPTHILLAPSHPPSPHALTLLILLPRRLRSCVCGRVLDGMGWDGMGWSAEGIGLDSGVVIR